VDGDRGAGAGEILSLSAVAGENAEIVRQLYAGFNRERHGTRELLDPEIEWINPEDAVEPGERHGLGGWDTALGRMQDSFAESRVEVERIAESGERVASAVTLHVRGRGSGAETEMKQSHLWTIRDGRAVRFEWFRDPERAFEALDASEG
jgi:ketosteroid isomerase-like protein